MSLTDQDIRDAVDAIFAQYDPQNTGALNASQVHQLINDAFKDNNDVRDVTPE